MEELTENFNQEELENQIREEAVYNLKMITRKGDVIETRILRTDRGIVSGYYDDFEKLVKDVLPYNGLENIYITINPVKRSVMARSYNHLIPYAKCTTSDAEIERRQNFFIDIDAKRPAGVSATDEEKEEARKVMANVRNFLVKEIGFCDGLVFDSGNGYHLIFAIDLPNNDEIKNLLKMALKVLDGMFSNEKAEVDVTTYNAARITKLYGTIACKGDCTDDRPHRWSDRAYIPTVIEEVPKEKIEELVAYLPKPPEPAIRNVFTVNTKNKNFDMDAFLEKHSIEVQTKKTLDEGNMWVLKECPWNQAHNNSSAFIIQFSDGGICAKCHHNSCKNETWQTLLDRLEPDWKHKNGGGEKAAFKNGEEEKETQAETLIKLAIDAELFHTPTAECYATVALDKCRRTFKIRESAFKAWLINEFYNLKGKPPANDAVGQALSLLESKALCEGIEQSLFLRVAGVKNKFYYDLADKNNTVIEITPEGYSVAADQPNVFRKTKNMVAQIRPLEGKGDINLLSKHIRSESDADKILIMVAVIACFIPDIAHPVMVLAGEKGAAKSTTMKVLKQIIDPAGRGLIGMPKAERDLAIALANSYAPCFDNIDSISAAKSDLLCMASTGGGVSQRKLYTDDEELFLEFKHCVFLNGINVVAKRPDLLDRSLIIELERISEEARKEERIVWQAFLNDLPAILDGIFSTLSKAMAIYPSVKLEKLPRMADFAKWGYAIAEAIDSSSGDEFLKAYYRNINCGNDCTINDDPTAAAIVAFMRDKSGWEGYVSDLYEKLQEVALCEFIDMKAYRWPKAPNVLTKRLKEVKSNLEQVGIIFETNHDKVGSEIRIQNSNCTIVSSSRKPRERKIVKSDGSQELKKMFEKVS